MKKHYEIPLVCKLIKNIGLKRNLAEVPTLVNTLVFPEDRGN